MSGPGAGWGSGAAPGAPKPGGNGDPSASKPLGMEPIPPGGFSPKLMEDTARERCVIFAMLTSRNQASRLKGLYRICLSKG